MNAYDYSKQGLETQIASETQNDPESEVIDGCESSKNVPDDIDKDVIGVIGSMEVMGESEHSQNDGLFSWSVLLSTLYLSTIGGSMWIITLQLLNKKLYILIYRSISYLGIVIYILASTNTTHLTNIITMVSHLPLQRHGFGESAHPTPGSLFGRSRTRSQ
jgi:hypothetical protein